MRNQRRGTIYILTLGTALIVALLAAAALLAVRARRRQADLTEHMLQAQCNAHTGLEMALFRIANNSTWRTLLSVDTWAAPVATRTGTYSFMGIDPDDGNVTGDTLDPVVLTAVGTCGPARQKVSVRLKMRNAGLRCLEPVINSKGNLVFDATTVNGNRLVSSNARVSATTGTQVYVKAESKLNPTASGGSVFYSGTSTDGTWPRTMPVASTVVSYYQTNGTAIASTDLPQWDAEQLANAGMSDGTTGWEPLDACTLTLDTAASQTPWSIFVDGRSGPGDGPSQVVTEKLQSGATFAVTADAKAASGSLNLRISLRVVSTGSGTQTFSTTWTTVDSAVFATVAGSITPTWTGSLVEAKWFVESESSSGEFWFDDAGLKDAEAQAGFLAIHRKVLSPACNPFGAGTTNTRGIYVIDCSKKPISIKDSRIVGTLVLLNYDATNSLIHGSMSWQPAVASADPAVANQPILVANKKLNFDTSTADLSEGLVNLNLNPIGTPYGSVQDSDKDDVVPSLFDGLIYVNGNTTVTGSLRLQGVMVIDGTTTFTGADVVANYDPLYYWYNAPPGFEDSPVPELVPGSFRRVVD
ncbi:MAG: hypothetical protein GXX96_14520 [Planctomycetaceae bacterium]|nr:hypothetical protein [Planctomycetaceae bacterium]